MKIKLIPEKYMNDKPVCANCEGTIKVGFLTELENKDDLEKLRMFMQDIYWHTTLSKSVAFYCYLCAVRCFAPVFYKVIAKTFGKRPYRFEVTDTFPDEGFYITETEELEASWHGKSVKQVRRLKEAGKIIEVKPEIV